LGFARFFDGMQSVSSTPAVQPPVSSHLKYPPKIPSHSLRNFAILGIGRPRETYTASVVSIPDSAPLNHAYIPVTILALIANPPDPQKHEIDKLRPANDEIYSLMDACSNKTDPQARPSSLDLLSASRKALHLVYDGEDSKSSRHLKHCLDFPLAVMTKYLSILFYSLRYSFAGARPDWMVRLVLYWEEFGHTIKWSEVERGFLNIIVMRAFDELKRKEEEKQKKKDEDRRKSGLRVRKHADFREFVQPKVDPSLDGCRWKTYDLSLLVLKDLVSLAISELEREE
jgi:hypothetical protein